MPHSGLDVFGMSLPTPLSPAAGPEQFPVPCTKCGADANPRAVTTVVGHTDLLHLTIVCDGCQHSWIAERATPTIWGPGKASAMSVSRENILIAVVDDDRGVGKGTQRLLEASGLNAIAFTSGAAFLESLTRVIPDCVVLDVVMPEPDGFAVQARLSAAGVTAPVIFLSASHDLGHRRQALDAGAFAFLEKAVDEEVLLEAIASALRGAGPLPAIR